MIAEHHALFMQHAFQETDNDVHDTDNRLSSLGHEHKLDHICFILKHWGGTINLKGMQDNIIRKQLSKFCHNNAVEKHHDGKYHFKEIMLPSSEKLNFFVEWRRGMWEELMCLVNVYVMLLTSGTGGSGHFGAEHT